MYKREPQNLTGPGGDQKELRVKYIDNGDGTWSLATVALALPLPDGAATAAKQDTTNIKLDDLIDAVNNSSSGAYSYRDKTETGTYKYFGFEILGGGAWKIMRKNISTNQALYATGSSGYSTNWSNRESLSYS